MTEPKTLTVRDAIAALQQLPPDMELVAEGYDQSTEDVVALTPVRIQDRVVVVARTSDVPDADLY